MPRSISSDMCCGVTDRRQSCLSGTSASTQWMKSLLIWRASARGCHRCNRNAPMPTCLLDRQVRLLEYLTRGVVVFGDTDGAPLDKGLRGIDRQSLRLQARVSHEKRMRRIGAIFPRTFGLLGDSRDLIIREFTDACLPTSTGFIENARQFRDFIWHRRERQTVTPPYLHEVAACELGLAEARAFAEDWDRMADVERSQSRNSIRRHPGVVLLRCAYDIRSVFAKGEA